VLESRFGCAEDASLRPHVDAIGVMTYDWVHNMFQNGVFILEASLFVKACQPLGITRQDICAFLQDIGCYAHTPTPHPKPYEFISFGWGYLPKPYKSIGFGEIPSPKAYEFIGFRVGVGVCMCIAT